jgi:hypothetical protein
LPTVSGSPIIRASGRQSRAIGARTMMPFARAAALAAAVLLTGPAMAASDAPAISIPPELRNVRYCEVITVDRERLTFHVAVYNTLGLNFCPAEQWSKLDARALAKQFDVSRVKLNGPRYWMIDGIEASGATKAGKIETFGGIGMVERATLTTKLWQGTVGDRFYKANKVARTTVFHYKAGRPVYELTAPNGDVYMMQSYAQIADPKLTMDGLAGLGSRLKLPKGWRFSTRTLEADYALKADGVAYVINDDLYNSYQRRPK